MKPGVESTAAVVRADVLVLLREKRYEEALARLYQARSDSPGSIELQKGIDQVKEFLIGAYAKRLGGLDQIAKPIAPAAGRSPDVVLVSRYIDGVSSYGDLAEICPLGRIRTLQVLIEMYGSGSIPESLGSVQVVQPSDASTSSTERSVGVTPLPPAPAIDDSPEAVAYRASFARGTAAFVQGRFADAIEAFEACARLRPGDAAADVMLRRARRDLESRA